MKRCIVRLSRAKPERPFEVDDGFTNNVPEARAWKAASETAGGAHNPESSSQLKGTKNKSSKITKTKESVKANDPPREWRKINQRLCKTHEGVNLL